MKGLAIATLTIGVGVATLFSTDVKFSEDWKEHYTYDREYAAEYNIPDIEIPEVKIPEVEEIKVPKVDIEVDQVELNSIGAGFAAETEGESSGNEDIDELEKEDDPERTLHDDMNGDYERYSIKAK